MGHRVAVLKDGILQQCDAPSVLYHEPRNLFVAGFIGSPAMNVVRVGADRPIRLGACEVSFEERSADAAVQEHPRELTLGFRPESVVIGRGPLRATIRTVEDLGSEVFVHLALDHLGERLALVAKAPAPFAGAPGEDVDVALDGTAYLFAEDGRRIAISRASFGVHV